MRAYRRALGTRDFRLLWSGSTASIFGDAMTLVALIWLVYSRGSGPGAVAGVVVAYGAPVAVGGLAAGWVLARLEPVRALLADSLIRGAVVVSIPVCAAVGSIPAFLPYVVAASYGLAKMLPLAGVPTLIASLVAPAQRDAANALETIAYGVGSSAGPALAGALIGAAGPEWVLAVDAGTFLVFAICLASMSPVAAPSHASGSPPRIATAFSFAMRSPPIRATTVMFATFNVGLGVLLVLMPVYARDVLGGGPGTYGTMAAAFAAGELVGALLAGALPTPLSAVSRISIAQALSGASLLALALRPRLPGAIGALLLGGLFSAPMTVWAQSLRMELTPPELRGHVFALLRTTMQAAPPAGGAVGGALVAAGTGIAAVATGLACGIPGGAGLLASAPLCRALRCPRKESNLEPSD
jgi:predicted MFS family arabinose efflux permease